MSVTAADLGETIWAVVALFEFADEGAPEQRVLYRGLERNCERFADRLERAAQQGRGLIYEGDRPVLHYIVSTCRASALKDD